MPFFQAPLLVLFLCLTLGEPQNNFRGNRNRNNNRRPARQNNARQNNGFLRNGVTRNGSRDRRGTEVYPGCNGKVCLPEANLCAERQNKVGDRVSSTPGRVFCPCRVARDREDTKVTKDHQIFFDTKWQWSEERAGSGILTVCNTGGWHMTLYPPWPPVCGHGLARADPPLVQGQTQQTDTGASARSWERWEIKINITASELSYLMVILLTQGSGELFSSCKPWEWKWFEERQQRVV